MARQSRTAAPTTAPAAPPATRAPAATTTTPVAVVPKKMSALQKWLMLLVSLVTLVIFMPKCNSGAVGEEKLSHKMNPTVKQNFNRAERSGVIIAVPGKWQGVTGFQGKRIDMTIEVDDVHWLVRFDCDDNRIYKIYPRNWRENSHLENNNGFDTMEVSIEPGQKITEAPIAWAISERRNVPSS
ncbi:MAG: hypothetical protein WCK03_00405 [Candidatus Taylorbacteria bacterium]